MISDEVHPFLPKIEEGDTEETWNAKLLALQVNRAKSNKEYIALTTIAVDLQVPHKLYHAYKNAGRLAEIQEAQTVFNRLFSEYLIKNYYEGKR